MPVVETVSDAIARKMRGVERYYRKLAANSRIMDEEELLADVMVIIADLSVVYPHLDLFEAEFDAILRQTVKNHIKDHARYKARRPAVSMDASPVEPTLDPSTSFYWLGRRSEDVSSRLDFIERLRRVRCTLCPADIPLWSFLTSTWDDHVSFDMIYDLNRERGLVSGKYRWTTRSIAYKLRQDDGSVRAGMQRIRKVVADVFELPARFVEG